MHYHLIKRILSIITLCLWLVSATALNLDSLWGVWTDTTHSDTIRLDAMNKLAWDGYLFSQPDSAYYFAGLKYQFAKEKGLKNYMANALNIQGVSFYLKRNYAKAIEYFRRCYKIKEEIGEKDGMARYLNNMGAVYKDQGDYPRAIDAYSRSLRLREELDDRRGQAAPLNNLGNIYRELNDYSMALDYFLRSLKIKEETGDENGASGTLGNIGLVYQDQGEYVQSMKYFTRSLAIKEKNDDKQGMGNALNNIGLNYKKQENYSKAMECFQRSLILFVELDDKKGQSALLSNLGNIYQIQGDYYQAIKYGKKALQFAKEVGAVMDIKIASKTLYKAYKKTGQHQKALKMHEIYLSMRDSIINKENTKAALRQQIQYEYDKEQALEDVKQEKKMALSKEREKRQKLILSATAIGLCMVLFIAGFIFNRLRITRNQKKLISAQKKKVEQQKRIIETKSKDITDSIRYAEGIQKSILPTMKQVKRMLPDSFIWFKPKDIVSGDFYWVAENNDKVYFAVCDCTGHGVPGSLMSVVGTYLLNEAVNIKGIYHPADIFEEVRRKLKISLKQEGLDGEQRDGMDAALCAWDKNNKLEFALAYNSLFHIRKGELMETKPDKQPVGFHNIEEKPYTHHELTLEKGDTIYLFSDGYVDQFGGKRNKKFMIKNFKKLLLSIQDKTMNEQKDILQTTMAEWKGSTEQVDDILVMGLRF